jgi:type 1 glutamine amidotransferase
MSAQPVNIMLVTGGHSYDTLEFIQMFGSFPDIEYKHFNQPDANRALNEGVADKFDVLVFYDMWKALPDRTKAAYIELTKKGKPFLFMHHSLVSYQDWHEFEYLIGGRYIQNDELPVEKQSDYKHDVWVDIEIADKTHPVTRGIPDFKLFDEVYGNYLVLPGVKPLLKTSHPESSPVIGWENRYNASTIIYLQPGHDKNAFASKPFKNLVLQTIRYLAASK